MKIISTRRAFFVLIQVVLICFSSTSTAWEASEYAFHFYRLLLGLGVTDSGLYGIVPKGIHFVLFFALGNGLYNSLNVARPGKVWWVIGICFLTGIGSEGIQLMFPGRHASVADVLLNGGSGTLAAALTSRCSRYSEIPERAALPVD